MTKIEAVRRSVVHWEENVDGLKNDGEFENDLYRFQWNVGYREYMYNSDSCSLCCKYIDDCVDCPLCKSGNYCECEDSLWERCKDAETKEDALDAAKNMLVALKKILKGLEGN